MIRFSSRAQDLAGGKVVAPMQGLSHLSVAHGTTEVGPFQIVDRRCTPKPGFLA